MTISRKIGNFWINNSLGRKMISAYCTCFGMGSNQRPDASPALGSLPGIALYFIFKDFHPFDQTLIYLVFVFLTVYAVQCYEKVHKERDAAAVTADETIGMWTALLFMPTSSFKIIIIAYIFFRFLDFCKLFPINMLQSFKDWRGVLADDLAAGMIVNFIIRMLIYHGMI